MVTTNLLFPEVNINVISIDHCLFDWNASTNIKWCNFIDIWFFNDICTCVKMSHFLWQLFIDYHNEPASKYYDKDVQIFRICDKDFGFLRIFMKVALHFVSSQT